MFLLVFLACAHRLPSPFVTGGGDAPTRAILTRDGVALAPVVFVHDLPAPPLPPMPPPGAVEAQLEAANLPPATVLDPVADGPFLRNDFVGNVRFGGGYIHSGDVTLQARARLMEFNETERYSAQAARWLSDTVAAALVGDHIPAHPTTTPWPPVDSAGVPTWTVDHVPRRGLDPDDGHDDINLPRTDLRFPTVPPMPGESPWLLVPLVRAYTTHSGGWFVGQEYGCMAGARVTVALVLYDTRTGQPVWWMEATGRRLDPDTATPSLAQMDQYLLDAEAIVAGAIDDRFPD